MITTKDAELQVVNALIVHVTNLEYPETFTDSERKRLDKAVAKFEKRLTKFRDTLLKQIAE